MNSVKDNKELSLLLFLEHCMVDKYGLIDGKFINDAEIEILKRWHSEGFIEFGRIKSSAINYWKKTGRSFQFYVRLSNDAWLKAHTERRARSNRMLEGRSTNGIIEES